MREKKNYIIFLLRRKIHLRQYNIITWYAMVKLICKHVYGIGASLIPKCLENHTNGKRGKKQSNLFHFTDINLY